MKKTFTKGKTTILLKQREYEEQKWKERKFAERKHFSHVDVTFDGDMISEQKIPGFCLLCTNQFHVVKCSIMKYHFVCVHLKNALFVINKSIYCVNANLYPSEVLILQTEMLITTV